MEDVHADAPPADARVDVVVYPSGEVKAVPAGKGADIVRSYRERERGQSTAGRAILWVIVAVILGYSMLIVRNVLLGVIAAGLVYLAFHLLLRLTTDADLLDADVALRDAREQWDAEPVSEVERPEERDRPGGAERRERDRPGGAERREREHAYE